LAGHAARLRHRYGVAIPTTVITGGAGGMGLATARILGVDHRVVIADVDQARLDAAVEELGRLGVDARSMTCDITDRAAVDALIGQANDDGALRCVVHTAGVSPQMGDARRIARINALGTVNVTRSALAVASDGFALVNVASIAGHLLPGFLAPKRIYKLALTNPAQFIAQLSSKVDRGKPSRRPGTAYSITKNFVIWYSAKMAAAFGAAGARILSVSPGTFDTAMGRLEEKSGSARLIEFAALKRFGAPEEMGELLAFCASRRAGYLTGVDILCDGGTRAGMTWRGMLSLARQS
jgi:NAD(P)-dependent dehydrogenase (short-subunit alcohol dehydrogenase family)